MKQLIIILTLIATACDKPDPVQETITGTWQITNRCNKLITFNSDGTGTIDDYQFTYTTDGRYLTMYHNCKTTWYPYILTRDSIEMEHVTLSPIYTIWKLKRLNTSNN